MYIAPSDVFIFENYGDDLLRLTPETKNALVRCDRRFHKLMEEYEREHVHFANVKNVRSEIDKYLEARKKGKSHKLRLEYEDSKFSDDRWCDGMIRKLGELKNDLITVDCYLTKFYIYRIDRTIDSIMFLNEYSHDENAFPKNIKRPSEKLYRKALEYLVKYKYQSVQELADKDEDYRRVFTPEESRKRLQKIIDRLGYGWKVIIDDNMIPRMSVRPYREFRINAKNNFSEVDLRSLEVHEIEVHTARKANALKTGLYLFLYGLEGDNIYDEGLAIYNSLNKAEKPKPNIIFFIAIKIAILYNLYIMDTDALYEMLLGLTEAPEEVVVYAIIRAMRVFSFTTTETAYTDTDYLDGYERVKEMDSALKKDLLLYTIGPDQLYELPIIKKFMQVNKFKPLEV